MIRHDVRIEDTATCMTEHLNPVTCDSNYENDGDEMWTGGHPVCPFHPRRPDHPHNKQGDQG